MESAKADLDAQRTESERAVREKDVRIEAIHAALSEASSKSRELEVCFSFFLYILLF